MKKYLSPIIVTIVVLALSVLGFVFCPPTFTAKQLEIFWVLLIICGSCALYCFVVGEITRNNSQMDKIWSIVPLAYTWVIAAMSGFPMRATMYAIIVTIWGIRLTFNFARKGAYSWKFWTGEEDYRWKVLRQNKYLKNKVAWAFFDLFFISIYQNVLVLAICLPSLMTVGSTASFGAWDYIATSAALFFILYESIADEQQMAFHTTKNRMLKEGLELRELPYPYNRGFNTTGLWAYSRHPNYLGEQMIWICLYLFVLGTGNTTFVVFNWSMIGPLFLVFLFLGSSAFGESVSNSKYPEYHIYLATVSKYIPFRKYNPDKYSQ